MPWAGNIEKTMMSNGKQFTVIREMLTAVAGISARYSKFAFVLFCYITNHNVSLDFVSGNIEILGKQNSLFPSGPVIKSLMLLYNTWIHLLKSEPKLKVSMVFDKNSHSRLSKAF